MDERHTTRRLSAARPQAGCDNIPENCSLLRSFPEKEKEFPIKRILWCQPRSSPSQANHWRFSGLLGVPWSSSLLVLWGGVGWDTGPARRGWPALLTRKSSLCLPVRPVAVRLRAPHCLQSGAGWKADRPCPPLGPADGTPCRKMQRIFCIFRRNWTLDVMVPIQTEEEGRIVCEANKTRVQDPLGQWGS